MKIFDLSFWSITSVYDFYEWLNYDSSNHLTLCINDNGACKFTSSDIAQLQQNVIGRELRISSDISKAHLILALARTRLLLVILMLARIMIPIILDLKQVLQFYMWKNYILEVIKADSCSYIHESFWNSYIIWSFTWIIWLHRMINHIQH